MGKFKVGEKVKYSGNHYTHGVATIIEAAESSEATATNKIQFADGYTYGGAYNKSLSKVAKKTAKKPVKKVAKKAVKKIAKKK